MEHLTSWPVVTPIARSTAQVVLEFMKQEVLDPFVSPRTVVSEIARCFTAVVVQELMAKNGSDWKTVLAYAPMPNGRAERMVGTMKRRVSRLVEDVGQLGIRLFTSR